MPPCRLSHLVAIAAVVSAAGAADLAAQRTGIPADRDRDWLEECRDQSRRDRARFCEERVMGWRMDAGRSLEVDAGPNGGVRVVGWDRDSVHVLVRVTASAYDEDEAREIGERVQVGREGGRLHAEGPGTGRNRWWSVSYEISAPRRADLVLETVNGPLAVEEISGRMHLDAVNGPLSLHAVGGDVRARTRNGPLRIRLEGTQWEGRGLDAETTNGPVVLEVPDGYNAELEAGTRNGPLDLGFPLTVQGRIGGGRMRHIRTTLGRGGAALRAVTTNGPAVLRRG